MPPGALRACVSPVGRSTRHVTFERQIAILDEPVIVDAETGSRILYFRMRRESLFNRSPTMLQCHRPQAQSSDLSALKSDMLTTYGG
jgi:hypothetical protein